MTLNRTPIPLPCDCQAYSPGRVRGIRTSPDEPQHYFNPKFSLAALLGPDGRVLQINDVALAICGVSREDVLGLSFWNAPWCKAAGATESEWLRRLEAAVKSGRTQYSIQHFSTASGEMRVAEVAVTAVTSDKGIAETFAIEAHDITQSRELAQELRDKEAMVNSAQRLAEMGSWVFSPSTGKLNFSTETYRILGIAQDSFDQTYAAFIAKVHPDDRAALDQTLERALAGQDRYSYRYRFKRQDGNERLIQGSGEIQLDSDGHPSRLVGIILDITEREQEREAVRRSEARFRSLTEISSDWYWRQDENLRFSEFSGGQPGAFVQEHRSFLIGKRRWDFPECEPLGSSWDAHRAILDAQQPFRDFQYCLHTASGPRYFSTSGEALFNADGQFIGYHGTSCDITSRKVIKEQLRQSNSLLAMAMRLSGLSAWSLDFPGMRLRWSSELAPIHGLPPDLKLTASSFLDFVDPTCRASLNDAIKACLREGMPFDIELRIFMARAPAAWIRLIGEPDRDTRGRVRRIQGAVQDITERREAADRAVKLGQRLTATLESVTDSFLTVNQEWRFTYVNHEAERLMRRSRSDLLGKVIWEEFPEAVDTIFHREYERAMTEFVTVEFETFYAPLGMWLQVKAYPSVQGLAIYFKDITDSHSMRAALADSEEQYRKLFESSLDGILQLRWDGSISRANEAACQMFRLSESQLMSLTFCEIVSTEAKKLAEMPDHRGRRVGGHTQLSLRRGDGSFFTAEISSAEYSTADGVTLKSVVLRDITRRIEAQREIEALNAELGEKVRQRTTQLESANSELRELAHSLAHDLRAPIAAIDGFGEVLDRHLGEADSERNRHYLRRIRASSRKMSDFTEGLLSMARISHADLEVVKVDLSAVAHDVLKDLHEHHSRRVVLTHIQPGLFASGDPRLLRMALENLLGNAWKFTARCDAAEIHFTAEPQNDGALVYCIADNGAGFDMAYADKLFTNFQRLHHESDFPGTGIGLVNVKKIVARHGGSIWGESVPERGAKFFFTLAAL